MDKCRQWATSVGCIRVKDKSKERKFGEASNRRVTLAFDVDLRLVELRENLHVASRNRAEVADKQEFSMG